MPANLYRHRTGAFIFVFITILFCRTTAKAQYKLNYGLQKAQDTATLPHSRATYTKPVFKASRPQKTILTPLRDNTFNITNGWQLAAGPGIKANGAVLSQPGYKPKNWYNAVVPGTVLTTLVKQGVYPDPYFGLNNLHIPDSLCREDWWYRTSFKIPVAQRGKNVFLNFEGINYAAEVWLNGKMIGSMKGAFKRGVFDVTGKLNASGNNILAVHIVPPPDPGIPHEESPLAGTGPNGGALCFDGPTFIATEGWDWIPGIRDRDMGIWQKVTLKFTGPVTITDPHIVTQLPLPDTTSAAITIEVEVHNLSAQAQQVVVKGEINTVKFQKAVALKAYQSKTVRFSTAEFKQLIIDHPRLWWPNGYGRPELYTLKLTAVSPAGRNSDEQTVRFGIRELSYEMTVNMPGNSYKRMEYQPASLKNDTSIFDNFNRTKAANDVTIAKLKSGVDTSMLKPSDDNATFPYLVIKVNGKRIYCKGGNWGMDDAMKNVSRQHLEPYFRLHRDAHFNMIRNWTGESTEQTFYDLCDEYGMLVWNDFWLSTEGFNLNVKDDSLFLANAADVVKRFRNHPSIAIWCPRNEGYAPAGIENKLADIIAKYDGTRYYQPNSRYMNLRTSGPWNYFTNPQEYEKIASGFSTELGTPSIPTAASMRKMMAKADVWPIGDVWYYHDLHDGQNAYIEAMDSLYGKATDLDDFCKKAQMLNYDSHRAMFEGWDSKLWNNTTGLLLWMSHPAWPSTNWQTYSWDYETFGSYFGCMKACEPVHVQMSLGDNRISVINTSLRVYPNAQIQLAVYDLAGKQVYTAKSNREIAANKLTAINNAAFPAGLSGVYLVRLRLSSNGQSLSQNDYWKTFGSAKNFMSFNKLANARLNIRKIGAHRYKITNISPVPAIAIKLNMVNPATKKIILPAYFSDGYFNLLPGEGKLITVDGPFNAKTAIAAEGYNVRQ